MKIFKSITPEYLEQLGKQCYEDDRNYPENFSNWYTHIVDFGKFKHANIISNQIFSYEEVKLMQKTDNIKDVDWNTLTDILKPTLFKMERGKLYNIKNGSYSNKFDFQTCVTDKLHLAENLWKINYMSHLYDTQGYTELVVREYIPFDEKSVGTIYNGMPLRTEVRVFYNLDNKCIEYMVDYWDYNYCYKHLTSLNDKVIFNWFHRETFHESTLNYVQSKILEYIDTLQFDDKLQGIWSIDFMYEDSSDDIYLIDMARGFRSAYWNPGKLRESGIDGNV